MTRLRLLQNKNARIILLFIINVSFIILWLHLNTPVLGPAPFTRVWIKIYSFAFGEVNPFSPLINVIHQLIRFVPIFFVSRWIWWGPGKRQP